MSSNRLRSTISRAFRGWPLFHGPAIVLINFMVVRGMFRVDYSVYLESNEGSFFGIIRHIAANPRDLLWWPYWDIGLPFQNTYFLGFHIMAGVFSRLTGHSAGLSFHQIAASFFCLGPLFAYVLALYMTRRPWPSFLGALAYSLLSPLAWLVPPVLADLGSPWNLRRLQIIGYYGEGPYTAAIGLLPIAILFLYVALTTDKFWPRPLAALFIGATVLTNAFGIEFVLMACLALIVTVPARRLTRSLLLVSAIGCIAYAWISPLLPPSVLIDVSRNATTVNGDYRFNLHSGYALILTVIGFVLIWWSTRSGVSTATRFFLLFSWQPAMVFLFGQLLKWNLLPQPHRYEVGAEMAICFAAALGGSELLSRYAPRVQAPVTLILLALAIPELLHERTFGRQLIHAIPIQQTFLYPLSSWISGHLPGQRVMVSGSSSFFLNALSDTPQLHGGHDPMEPSFLTLIATFTLYSGMNAGSRDAAISILWLKALGSQAIFVPGAATQDRYKPYDHPKKFEGVLPVIWREGDDTVYSVPCRSRSLAHVIDQDYVIKHFPSNGLDVAEMEKYVKALDEESLPGTPFQWTSAHHATIQANIRSGQVISVQERFAPGWHAYSGGHTLPISPDGLGMIVIAPVQPGTYRIDLDYDGGLEWKITLAVSAGAMLGMALWGAAFKVLEIRRSPDARSPIPA